MKSKKLWIYVLTASLVCLSILFVARTIATEKQQYQEELRMRLRGSDGVYILVDVLAQTNTAQEELKQQFEEDVDLELQESEIKIFTKEELENIPGRPRLSVYVVAFEDPSYKDVYLYSVRIAHIEDATLVRNYGYAAGSEYEPGNF